jgi:hypothetical protein
MTPKNANWGLTPNDAEKRELGSDPNLSLDIGGGGI